MGADYFCSMGNDNLQFILNGVDLKCWCRFERKTPVHLVLVRSPGWSNWTLFARSLTCGIRVSTFSTFKLMLIYESSWFCVDQNEFVHTFVQYCNLEFDLPKLITNRVKKWQAHEQKLCVIINSAKICWAVNVVALTRKMLATLQYHERLEWCELQC